MATRKKINGQNFKMQTRHNKKATAQKKAEQLRKQGIKARVIPRTSTKKTTKFEVYARV